MLHPELEKSLNEQIKHEFYSSYLYLAMSAWCEEKSLPGFAKWLRVQYEEEKAHALKFFDYIADQGGTVKLGTIDAPPVEYKSVLDLFEHVLAHEKKVTSLIWGLYEQALGEKDYATQGELQWFIKEQIEEEKNASLWVDHLRMVGDKSAAILNLDHQAGKRG